jgi:hypothetical protein
MIPNLTIRTKEERDTLLSVLDEAQESIFSGRPFDLSTSKGQWDKYIWFESLRSLLESLKDESLTPRDKDQKIKDVRDYLATMEVVKISLSFVPSEEFIKNAYATLMALEPKGLIIEFLLDASISFGGKLFYKGRYVDLTLRSRISNLLEKEDAVNNYL